ncbi:M48 family metallopeptidase [Oricola indica]|uniref:M48 family metallopeptidase n=1 Tax=Oricola indica TaxID=2872591 RepID=UPI001CBAA0E1|nr:SprT family zinc-dependent metalloprotease [Oricola indica]
MQPAISYGDRRIEYTISTNAELRERVRIHVHPNGTVEVETPLGKTDKEIAIAVLKRARWIDSNLRQFERLREHSLPRQYVSGETHFYLGRRYQLKVIGGVHGSSSVRMKAGQIQVQLPCPDPAAVKRRLNEWYKSRAKLYLQDRLCQIAADISWVDVPPPIKLAKMKTQWGSCSPAGHVYLNPMLIKAPRECIDYVIVHELCHLQEHNHSKRFYALLHKELPTWKHIKAKLDGMAELLLSE